MRNVTRCPMKRVNNNLEFNTLPPLARLYIHFWQLSKGYKVKPVVDFADLVEISLALPLTLSHDTSLEYGTYNNILNLEEFVAMWDGSQPYDTLYFHVTERIKKAINGYMVVNRSD